MQRSSATAIIGVCFLLFLSSCDTPPQAPPTQTVTVTPTDTQTANETPSEPGLVPTTPVPTATSTGTAGAGTASPTGSPLSTGTESPTATETTTGTATPGTSPTGTEGTTGSPNGQPTITIKGKQYGCSDISEVACDQGVMDAFTKWGGNVDAFANSDRIGPLGTGKAKLPDTQIARIGLLACMYSEMDADSNRFLGGAAKIVPKAQKTDLLLMWFEAQRTICPELPIKG